MSVRTVHSDPEILGGNLVFVGTRVPVLVIAALEQAKEHLIADARAA